jgi:hypothetical protein
MVQFEAAARLDRSAWCDELVFAAKFCAVGTACEAA